MWRRQRSITLIFGKIATVSGFFWRWLMKYWVNNYTLITYCSVFFFCLWSKTDKNHHILWAQSSASLKYLNRLQQNFINISCPIERGKLSNKAHTIKKGLVDAIVSHHFCCQTAVEPIHQHQDSDAISRNNSGSVGEPGRPLSKHFFTRSFSVLGMTTKRSCSEKNVPSLGDSNTIYILVI